MRPLPFFLFVTDAVVNVSERGRRWKEHDEVVKMVNFSRTRKPAKCDLDKNPRDITGSLVPGLWSPGSRPDVRYGDAVRNCLNLDNF